jgi:toxin ParE1/3/4
MASFNLTNSAVQDLTEIWDYTIKNWSEKQAELYYNLIIDTFSVIAKKPQMGKDYNEIYPNLKGQKVSKHVVFYRVMGDSTIEITRILHERMDLKDKLK